MIKLVRCETNCFPYHFSAIDRRVLAEGFWWGQLEAELRENGMVSRRFHHAADREACMVEVNAMRTMATYPHSEADCSPDCKARGK